MVDFGITWTLCTSEVRKPPNQEINATNHGECHTRIRLEAFGQINAEYAFGIQPNQRSMRQIKKSTV